MKSRKRKIIGIAGGSGSGKSTLAVALCKKYPNEFALLHVDDYFQKRESTPKQGELTNWDHPEAIRFNDLYNDLLSLQNGGSITIRTKSELYNPDYKTELRNKIEYTIEPRPIIILEGYLALYDRRVRDLMDIRIYLDMPIEASTKRRSDNKFNLDKVYFNKILAPMYKKFVEPTRIYANLVIDVLDKNESEVLELVENKIFN